jgi:hypothetical protein
MLRACGAAGAAAGALLCLAPAAGAEDFRQSIAAEPGGQLEIRLDVGSVEVEGSDGEEIEVEARATNWGPLGREMHFELSGDGVRTRLRGTFVGWAPGIGGPSVRVRVRVPTEHSLDVETRGGSVEVRELEGDVVAQTSGGQLEVNEIEGDVRLRTSGGSIDVEEVDGDLGARTSGGSISASEVSGAVDVRTSGGSIHLSEVGGPVEARTSGGSITTRFEEAPAGTLETSGGGIAVDFAGGAEFTLEARTSGGRVTVEAPLATRGRIESDHVEGDVNGGGPRLRLRTSGGNITVRED